MRPSSLYDIMQTATVVLEAKDSIEYIHMDDSSALLPGGVLSLSSSEVRGLLCQYIVLGVLYGVLPGLVYPLFDLYLGLTGYEVVAYSLLVSFSWLLKILFGILSDSVAIKGYRRKPWMLFGWVICIISFGYLMAADFHEPFCKTLGNECNYTILSHLNASEKDRISNLATMNNGHLIIIASAFSTIGYAMISSASDAMMVHYSQREPMGVRGRFAAIMYAIRAFTGILGHIYVCIFTNSKSLGGDFTFDVKPNIGFALLFLLSMVAFACTLKCIVEPCIENVKLMTWLSQFYHLMHKQVLWQVCAFRFLFSLFSSFRSGAMLPVYEQWGRVTPLDASIMDSCSLLSIALAFWYVSRAGINWNWRWLIGLATASSIALEITIAMIVIWDILRTPSVMLIVSFADQLAFSIRLLVAIFCAIEIAELGNEGTVFGLVTNINNWATPFGALLNSYIDKTLNVSENMWLKDSSTAQHDTSVSIVISFCIQLLALVWLGLLPPQKLEMLFMKNEGSYARGAARLLLLISVLCLSFSIVTTAFTITPDASCFRLANGHC